MGSTVEARRAGTNDATKAVVISSRVTPVRIRGSRELSFTHRVDSLSKAKLRSRPVARPTPRLVAVEVSTMRKTSCKRRF